MICTYCGKDIIDLENLKTLDYEEDKVLVCSDKCASDFRNYKRVSNKNKAKFFGITIFNCIITVILYILGFVYNNILDVVATFYIFEVIGITILKYPYVDISNVKAHGILKSTSIAKRRGIILLILGFVISIGLFFCIKELRLIK